MTKTKRLVAVVLAVLMILSSFTMAANAWTVADDGSSLDIRTEILRQVDGVWTATEKVKQGEAVKARIYLETDYYTNSGQLLFFYNNNFFTDSFGSSTNTVTVNPYYTDLPYGITGTFVGSQSNSDSAKEMVGNGKITADFAKTHNFVNITYSFYSGSTNQLLDGSQWLFEIPLTVKADATGSGDFFAVEETTRTTTFQKGIINVPKGPYNAGVKQVQGMHLWNADYTYSSQPVTIFENFVTASFDAGLGKFANNVDFLKYEGDAGDALSIPDPTLANYKFLGWKVKGEADDTAAAVTAYPSADTEYEAVWFNTSASDETLNFITKIYRQDAETGEWIYTEKVKPGEKVKARLFIDTSYYTNSGDIIVFYDKDFFKDGYTLNFRNALVANDAAVADRVITGNFAKIASTNSIVTGLVSNGYITQDFADTHQAITVMYSFEPTTSQKISGDDWFAEFELTVLDTAKGEGEFFVEENTLMATSRKKAHINIPLGSENGPKEAVKSMHLWDVNATIKSYPVTVNSTITLQANGGAFAAADTATYVIDGVIGDKTDYSLVPELTRDGYTFKGWVDASIAEPTEEDIVALPSEIPYDDVVYNAYWINEVTVSFIDELNNTTITKTVTAGEAFEAPAAPKFEGYTFVDWTDDSEYNSISGLPPVYPATDKAYYAVYETLTYTVDYYVLNTVTSKFSLITSNQVEFGGAIAAVPAIYTVPEGYTLSKGYTDVTFTKELAANATMPAKNIAVYYYLTPEIYDATFYVDGAVYDTVPTIYGELIEAPEDPTKEGYEFAGWDPYVGEMDEPGKSFIATWNPIEYTVTYIADGKTHDEFTVPYDMDLDVASEPDVEGYEFLGWAEEEGSTVAVTLPAKMPANNLVYYAILDAIEYTIEFAETGDKPIDPIKQDYGTEIPEVADPTKEGYTFKGWKDADGNIVDVPATMPAKNQVLTATWEINSYTVTWDVDGDTSDVDILEFGAAIVEPEKPTKAGYEFAGWTPKVKETMPAEDLVYVATWDAIEYDAVFYLDAEKTQVHATVPTDFDAAIKVPDDPTKTGYVFSGWDPATGMDKMDTVGGEEYVAQWSPAKDTKYTVNYYTMDTEGNDGTPVTEIRTGETDSNASVATTVTEGFKVDETRTTGYDAATKTANAIISADGNTVINVYYVREQYTITFDAVDGTLIGDASKEYYYGATVAVPTVTDPTGYTFKAWTPSVSTVAVADANYTATYTVNEYTINFETGEGTPIDSVVADYGSEVALPEAVTTNEGYTFNGWAETEGETSKDKAVTFPVTVGAADKTYYAIWTPNEYTITFDTVGGSKIDAITQAYKTEVTEPAAPTKPGYDFGGWDIDVPDTMPAYNMTITAKWNVKSYDITWTVDGEIYHGPTSTEFGTEIVKPDDPIKDGYTFTGWDGYKDGMTVPVDGAAFEATWQANKYTITFDTDGGSEVAPITQDYDTDITADTTTAKTGYDFAGWVDEDNNPARVPAKMPLNGMTLKATWTPKNDTVYKVVVNYTDYTTGEAATEVLEYTGTTDNAIVIVETEPAEKAPNTEYVLLSDITLANYEFDATAENELTGVVAADGSTVLNIYYVPVKKTATFNANGGAFEDGETTKEVVLAYNSLVKPNAPADPVRDGYTFLGWNGLNDATKLTADRPFNANWEANTYTVTWVFNNGTADVVEPTKCDAPINKQAEPAKAGYSFAGWEWVVTDEDGNETVIAEPTLMPAGNVTVTATWDINSYDIVWDVDGKETTEKLEYGSVIETPADPTKEGYTFAGWDGYTEGMTVPVGGAEFTAKWDVNSYKVTYFVYEPANGKFAAAGEATVDYGTAIPTALAAYTIPEGYSLVEIAYTDAALSTPLAAGKTMPAEDVVLYYTLEALELEAIFNANGGAWENDVTSQTVKADYNSQIVAPAAPERTGYTFTGWTPAVGTMNDVNGKTFNAVWEINTYNVTYKANGGKFADGETIKTVPYEFGAAVTAPTDITKDGYKFTGWTYTAVIDGVDTTIAAPATMPAYDVTATANWEIQQFTITFNTDGGSTVAPITQAYGTAIKVPTAPTKEGYSFAGWENLPTTMPGENTTAKALWTKNTYKVTWNVDGEKTVVNYEYGATIKAIADPVKDGHTFKGWSPAVDATMPAHDVEYVATWNVTTYTATFDANGGQYKDGKGTKTAEFAYGAAVVVPEIPTQTGFAFVGWDPTPSTMPAENTTYKAVWTSGVGTAYTVEFYTMDTKGDYGDPVKETRTGETGKLATVVTTETDGFKVDEEKSVLSAVVTADGNTVLKVYYARETVTITYDANEGTIGGAATKADKYFYGATIVLPAEETLIKEGHTFDGWAPGVGSTAVADSTHLAQWDVNEYTITFAETGDTPIDPITKDYGEAIGTIETPVKEGYDFKGWTYTTVIDGVDTEVEAPATMPAYDTTAKANWELSDYTVIFYGKDGEEVYKLTADYTSEYNVPDYSATGYEFNGWVLADGTDAGLAAGGISTIPLNGGTYYADVDVNSYKLTYKTYNGVYEEFTVDYNAETPAPEENPTRDGYTFNGWLPAVPGNMPARDFNTTAQWLVNYYDANFYKELGDETPFTTVEDIEYNTAITAPTGEAPQKEGYTFKGWSTDGKTPIEDGDYGVIGAEDAKFYAVWEINSKNVTFDVDGTVYEGPTATVYGTEIAVPATDPTKTGYTFTGWKDAEGNDIPDAMPDNDVIFYAQWAKETYTVAWDVDGDVTTDDVAYGDAIEKPEAPTKDGYTFAGWSPEVPDTIGDIGNDGDTVTYTAQWTANNYNVTYMVDGKVYDGPNETAFGGIIALPATAPTKAGYSFDKWVEQTDGKQPNEYGTMPSKDLEFEALWTANVNVGYIIEIYQMDTEGKYPATATYTIKNTDGVVGEERAATVDVPAGFVLDTDAEGSKLEGTIPAEGKLVLKAFLERKTYTLTVDPDVDVADNETSYTYYYNEEVDKVADPTKTGYTFAGWLDADGEETTVPVVMPANDVTIYADWKVNTLGATFDAGDGIFKSTGKPEETVNVDFGEAITAPSEKPEKEGYEFLGWAVPTDPETVITNYGKMDEDGAEFVAVWNKTDFKVTFYDYKAADGVNAPTEKYALATGTYQFGDTILIPGDPSFEHYVFLGWSEVEGNRDNLITSEDVIKMPSGNYDLFAVYERVQVKLIPENDTCTTVIDRAGGDVDDYTADSKWYVYGLEEYIDEQILNDDYIDVQGDGRIEIKYVDDGMGGTWAPNTGTGTVINVYDRMGTDATDDDILVESFWIIIFGDLNGDAYIEAIDSTYVFDETIGLTHWSNENIPNDYIHYMVMAADITGDGMIDATDGSIIADETIGILGIDQVTGREKANG